MRGVPFLLLSLALLPAAFGFTIEDRARLSLGANFEACSNLEAMLVEPGQVSMLALFENVSQFGSLTGFIDYSPTDSILRFLDEYVMALRHSREVTHPYSPKVDQQRGFRVAGSQAHCHAASPRRMMST